MICSTLPTQDAGRQTRPGHPCPPDRLRPASGRAAAATTQRLAATGGPLGDPRSRRRGNRVRTVTVPAGVKARLDVWGAAAGITEGRISRPVTRPAR